MSYSNLLNNGGNYHCRDCWDLRDGIKGIADAKLVICCTGILLLWVSDEVCHTYTAIRFFCNTSDPIFLSLL